MKTTSISKALVVAVALLHTAPLLAQQSVPAYISYQGFAKDADDKPLEGTDFKMTFCIWSHASSKDKEYLVWSEEQSVDVHEGSFSVLLGDGLLVEPKRPLIEVFTGNQELYLGVTIDISGDPPETEIKPRLRFLSSPFSFVAQHAQRANLAKTVEAGAINAASIDASAVTSEKIEDGAVATVDIADEAIDGTKVKNGSLTGEDIKDGSLTAAKLADDVGVWTRQDQNIVRTTGKVGIGVTKLQAPLHVKGTQMSSGTKDVFESNCLRLEEEKGNFFWDIRVHVNRGKACSLKFVHGERAGFYITEQGSLYRLSDGRLKKDIAPLNAVLERALHLRPITYRLKDSADGAPQSLGFIAQEVQPLFPSVVDEHDGKLMLSYTELIPVAIGAIQELDSKVEAENQALRKENADLRVRLDRLEKLVERLAEERHPCAKWPTTANVNRGAE